MVNWETPKARRISATSTPPALEQGSDQQGLLLFQRAQRSPLRPRDFETRAATLSSSAKAAFTRVLPGIQSRPFWYRDYFFVFACVDAHFKAHDCLFARGGDPASFKDHFIRPTTFSRLRLAAAAHTQHASKRLDGNSPANSLITLCLARGFRDNGDRFFGIALCSRKSAFSRSSALTRRSNSWTLTPEAETEGPLAAAVELLPARHAVRTHAQIEGHLLLSCAGPAGQRGHLRFELLVKSSAVLALRCAHVGCARL